MNDILPVSPAKSAIPFGALFGIIMVLEFMAAYTLDIDPISNQAYGVSINVLNYLILPVLFISLQCNNYKRANSGYISFVECLKIGVTICLFAGLIYALFSVVFNMLFPEFIEDLLRKTRTVLLEKNPAMTDEQVNMALSFTRKFMNPAIVIPATVVMFSFIGLIYSLIIGAIVKNDKKQSFN